MKYIILIALSLYITKIEAQENEHISILNFIEVLNNNKAETLFYYKNNWQQLRIKALEKGYIESYKLLETEPTNKTTYQFILITTYANMDQYNKSEERFQELINKSGGLKLLNKKKPSDFRKLIFANDKVIHLN